MKTDKQLWDIVMNIYRELYKKSTPPADIDKLIKQGATNKHGWWEKYYLDGDVYSAIVEKHIKKHKLSKWDKKAIYFEAFLGCGPTSARKKKKAKTENKDEDSRSSKRKIPKKRRSS